MTTAETTDRREPSVLEQRQARAARRRQRRESRFWQRLGWPLLMLAAMAALLWAGWAEQSLAKSLTLAGLTLVVAGLAIFQHRMARRHLRTTVGLLSAGCLATVIIWGSMGAEPMTTAPFLAAIGGLIGILRNRQRDDGVIS